MRRIAGGTVAVDRCLHGRLAAAYPASRHDVELRVFDREVGDLTAVLMAESDRILREDPRCRKVVFAASQGDLAEMAAAERAGFRFVVDVDVPGAELSLMVREPPWVYEVDIDLDRVPGS